MKVLIIMAFIAALLIIIYIGAMAKMSYDKKITKMAIWEYEEEKHRQVEYETALNEIDKIEKELNEKSRE